MTGRRRMIETLKFLLILMAAWSFAIQPAFAQRMNSGWYWPTGSSNVCGYLGWLGYNSPTYPYHLAQDMCNPRGNPVYSIGSGTVIYSRTDAGGYGQGYIDGGALVARYQAADGTWFTALYGHLDSPHSPGPVAAGEILGYSNAFSPPHLHFGIHPGFDPELANPWRGYTSSTSNTYGFTDPILFLNAHPLTISDPLITALANSTQPVRWFYIMNHNTGAWYIVSPTGEQVMFLDKVDRNTSFGIYWRPVNNSSFQTYPTAGRNFSSVSISADGRTIYVGSAVGSANDPHVSALANTTQPVRWFYIMNESSGAWYIVSPTGQQVMFLDRVDQNTPSGIFWKPINNSSFQGYATASQNYSFVNISSDGRAISFGPLR